MSLRPLARSLIVPVLGLSLSGLGQSQLGPEPPKKVVNLNTGEVRDLMNLPGIGFMLATSIVAHRKKHGAFRYTYDLVGVKGIGDRFFETLKPYLAVSGPTTLAEKVGGGR